MKKQFANYLYKGVHQAKIEELKETYREKGFEEKPHDDNINKQFDIMLQHRETGKIIAFDVNFAPIPKDRLEELNPKKEYALQHGYDFRLITIVRRSNIKNQINWLQPAFYQYVLKNVPDIITKYDYRHLDDASIFVVSVSINDDIAQVQTEGAIEAEVGDNGTTYTESFPFTAEMTLNLAKHSIESADLKVDDSLFY